ncbi:MAG: ankyrin repeat domain-containing protein [Alphaproteobacteria bacterium]|nr:ankyrin repeat domain-containing protein [Alphaproteobacteria bacterium]
MNEPHTVCTVRLFPEADAFAKVIETMPLFRAMRDVHGAGECYLGSLGWRAPPFDSALPTILYRPWRLKPDGPEDVTGRRQADILRETHYLRWGLSDPQSWRDYLEVKASRQQFLRDLAFYYRTTGKAASKAEAKDLAERSWRLVLDTLMYGADSFDFDLRKHNAPITPDSSPAAIVRYGVASTMAERSPEDAGVWKRILLAAIYTRQPLGTVRTLVEKVDGAFAADLRTVSASNVDGRNHKTSDQADYWRQALIAALGHNELTRIFLERANPDVGTNGFDKTPLMYAAQHDRLNAVWLLLEHGAKVDLVTDDTKGHNWCLELDRDHRTALMYAAENASPAVIDALLDAGASAAAADTQGNTPLWYFSRNAKVTNPTERARLIKRLGG